MIWQPLAWAVVVVVALVVELNNAAAVVDDAALLARANNLRSGSANLDLTGLAARFALLPQYDGLRDAEAAMALEIAAMRGACSPGGGVGVALASFDATFVQRRKKLEELTAVRGLLTGTAHYVPVLLRDLRAQRPDEPLVTEGLRAVLAWQVGREDDVVALHDLEDVRNKLRDAGEPLATVAPHLTTLIEARRALVATTHDHLTGAPLAKASDAVFEAVAQLVAEHGQQARAARVGVLALAVLVALASLWLPGLGGGRRRRP